MRAKELGLVGVALSVALELEKVFPMAVFTSGHRTLAEQAHAMAGNVVRNRQWIAETYVVSAASAACQAWVDANLGASLAETANGLLVVLQGLTPEELEQLTHHLVGCAFDVQPRGGLIGTAMLRWLQGQCAANGGKLLTHEGGLSIVHAQFPIPVPAAVAAVATC